MTTFQTSRLVEAFEYAVELHHADVRKGTGVPYLAHLLGVCALVMLDGGTEPEAIAALLHDALEDHPAETSRETIRERFQREVAQIVEDCTDTPSDYRGGPKPSWHQRKEAHLAHVRTASAAALRVILADKLDNARAMLLDYRQVGDALWSRFRAGRDEQLWYYRSLIRVFHDTGVTGPLLQELESTIGELERRSGAGTRRVK